MKRVALLTLSLLLASGCSRTKKPKPDVPPPLDGATVQRLLADCEAMARKGDVKAFRTRCLTSEGAALLDRGFAEAKKLQRKALTETQELAAKLKAHPGKDERLAPIGEAFTGHRRTVQQLGPFLGWKAHLAMIARAPRCQVEQLKRRGPRRATFVKRAGQRASRHFLEHERGQWRVDLVRNPLTGQRMESLKNQVALTVAQLKLDATALKKHLEPDKGKPDKPKPR